MVQPVAQQAAAHGRAAGVEQRVQRRRFGAAQGFGQFEVAARGRIEADVFGFRLDLQAAHVAQLLALRGGGIQQQGAGRAAGAGQRVRAEAVEARDVELAAQALGARGDVEVPGRHARDRAGAGRHGLDRRVGGEDFGRADPLERRAQFVGRDFREPQRAAGEVEPGQAHVGEHAALVVAQAQREQVDVGLVGEQGGVGQRAGRDHAHHLALDRALRGGGVADLLADRHRFAELHQLRQVLLDRVVRHAGHLDRVAGRRAALREGQVEQARGFFGVVVEQLVEVAHPVEDERVRMIGLDAQVLLHHGRVAAERRFRKLLFCIRNFLHVLFHQGFPADLLACSLHFHMPRHLAKYRGSA